MRKIQPFTGASPNLAYSFIDSVEDACTLAGFDQLQTAELNLRGKADEVMRCKKQDYPGGISWSKWKEEFLKELSDTPHLVDAQARYEKISQKPNESIQSYISRCVVLLNRIECTGDLTKISIKHHTAMVKGIRNKRFKDKVGGKELERCKNMLEIINVIKKVEEQGKRIARYNSDVSGNEGDDDLEETNDTTEEINEVRLNKRYNKNSFRPYKGKDFKNKDYKGKDFRGNDYKRNTYGKSNYTRKYNSNKTDVTCWFCERPGHTYTDCYRAKYWKKFNKMPYDDKMTELAKRNERRGINEVSEHQEPDNFPPTSEEEEDPWSDQCDGENQQEQRE